MTVQCSGEQVFPVEGVRRGSEVVKWPVDRAPLLPSEVAHQGPAHDSRTPYLRGGLLQVTGALLRQRQDD